MLDSKEDILVAESEVEIRDITSESRVRLVLKIPVGLRLLVMISSPSSDSESLVRLMVFPGWNVDTESSSCHICGTCSGETGGIWIDTVGSWLSSSAR